MNFKNFKNTHAFSFLGEPGLHLETNIPCLADHWTCLTNNRKGEVNKLQGFPKSIAWVPEATSSHELEV